MENLIDKKVKGFKFESGVVNYNSCMDEYIGKIGEIDFQTNELVRVTFEDKVAWSYPLDQIEEHLVPEYEIGKKYEFSDAGESWFQKNLLGIINHEYKYLVDDGSVHGTFHGYKQIREIKPKELTLEEIAEKFGCDVNKIKIKK